MWSRICLVLFVCAFAMQARADVVTPKDTHPKLQILVLDLRADGVAPDVARSLGEAVASELAHRPNVEVMTMADVRGVVELAADTAAAGCDDPAHCEAAIEFAGAHGASVVMSGSVGLVDGAALLTLTAVDTRTSRMLGRITTNASQVRGLLPKVPGVIDELLGAVAPRRVSAWTWVGGGVVVAGVVVGAVFGGLAIANTVTVTDVRPPPAGPSAADKATARDTGRTDVFVAAGGAAVALVGVVVMLVGGGGE